MRHVVVDHVHCVSDAGHFRRVPVVFPLQRFDGRADQCVLRSVDVEVGSEVDDMIMHGRVYGGVNSISIFVRGVISCKRSRSSFRVEGAKNETTGTDFYLD